MSCQYANPVTVLAFNLAERAGTTMSRTSDDIAREIQMLAELAHIDLSSSLDEFVERHAGGRERQLAMRLVWPTRKFFRGTLAPVFRLRS